jgi:prevent-host-death family protein
MLFIHDRHCQATTLSRRPSVELAAFASVLYDHSSHNCSEGAVREIQLRDAKARLSSVVDDAVRGRPAVITRHGKRQAVIVGFEEWQRLSQVPSFGRLLMSAPVGPHDLPDRNRTRPRTTDL